MTGPNANIFAPMVASPPDQASHPGNKTWPRCRFPAVAKSRTRRILLEKAYNLNIAVVLPACVHCYPRSYSGDKVVPVWTERHNPCRKHLSVGHSNVLKTATYFITTTRFVHGVTPFHLSGFVSLLVLGARKINTHQVALL